VPTRRSAPKVRRSRMRPTRREVGGDTAPTVRCRSGRQAMAALVAPRLEDGPAGPGGHAMSKPVSLCSFTDVWLVGALHCSSSAGRGEGLVRMAEISRVPSARAEARTGVAPRVTLEDNAPTKQSAIVHGALFLQGKTAALTPWMPVDRVLRCPGHGRRGVRRRCPERRIADRSPAAHRDVTGTKRALRRRRSPIVVHRVWTYLWTRTDPGRR
jgi:hypothetical protein